ncbi:hypothetical protein CRENBAI_005811 [Crenichthys baileyi]|uniref:Uncharacterized protein n=1 Tax=Crenichthys baileyi TaxID=28760 RepID=A0AAV9QWM4_9TELE
MMAVFTTKGLGTITLPHRARLKRTFVLSLPLHTWTRVDNEDEHGKRMDQSRQVSRTELMEDGVFMGPADMHSEACEMWTGSPSVKI